MTETISNQSNKPGVTLRALMDSYKEALSSEKLAYFACDDCGHKFPYPRVQCPRCRSFSISLKLSGGKGKIIAFTVVYRSANRSVKIPYVVAIVELFEGVRVDANVTYSAELAPGKVVEARFSLSPNGAKRPIFDLTTDG